MNTSDILLTTPDMLFAAFFCFAMVFGLLGGLFVSIKISTGIIKLIESKAGKTRDTDTK